jgi:hypothetical protein
VLVRRLLFLVNHVLNVCDALFAGDKPWETEKVMLGSWARGEMYIKDIIEVRRLFLLLEWHFLKRFSVSTDCKNLYHFYF